jgi:hypothetical protein
VLDAKDAVESTEPARRNFQITSSVEEVLEAGDSGSGLCVVLKSGE